ncbi:MAG: NADH:flavin oxidoreductase [Gammaproteobacteria bacterium]
MSAVEGGISGSPGSTEILFTPLEHSTLPLKNRIVMAPMTRWFSPDGIPGPDVAAYYRRRAEGGAGLIITEGTFIDHPATLNYASSIPRLFGDQALAGWRHVVGEVHAAGARIMAQLWHTGLVYAFGQEQLGPTGQVIDPPHASPSGFVEPGHKVTGPMTDNDIADVIASYARAAAAARQVGFDGVEIHAAHGYLIDQFFWEALNKRTDRYGVDVTGRTRLMVDILTAMRAEVGADFPICIRYSQWKQQDYTARLADTPQELERFLEPIADAGPDFFHCSQRRFWESEFSGSDRNLAGWTRKITGLPVITVGSVGLREDFMHSFSEGGATQPAGLEGLVARLERGDFDLVAVGRALLGDANWPNRVRSGDTDRLRGFDTSVLETLN